jgi:hypothetical protein
MRATCKSLSRSVVTGSFRILESFSLFVAQILLSLYFHLVINNLPMLPILIRSHIIMSCRFHIKTICDRINILVTKGKHFLTWLKYNESHICTTKSANHTSFLEEAAMALRENHLQVAHITHIFHLNLLAT